jgi:GSH-dependent disulfide-bond oxidoreductase
MIELYGMFSPNVRKIGIMLEELGLAYTLHHVAVFRGDQFEPSFLALNPLGKVPVLIDHERGGGQPIFESGAILIYLAETYRAFLPASGPARYEVLEWLMAQMASIGPMFGQHNHFQLLGAQAEPYAAARYRTQAETLYRKLDDRLATHDWIAGGAYSIADMAIHPWSTYLEQHGFSREDHPHLLAWRTRIAARPAMARMMARFTEAFSGEADSTRRAATPDQLDRFFGRAPDNPPADFSAVTRA